MHDETHGFDPLVEYSVMTVLKDWALSSVGQRPVD